MIEITLKTEELHLGEVVSGGALWTPAKPTKVKALRVELLWQTEGRGDRDYGVVGKDQTTASAEVGLAGLRAPFSFRLPTDGPMSYDGHYIRLLWLLKVRADIPWARDEVYEHTLLVGPAVAR